MSENLNEKQLEAVSHKNGPLLIAAGAGSGKTKTLTSRIIKLLESGVPPNKILSITFTNKAAGEMKKRVISHGLPIDGMFLSTFHSFGANILRKESGYFKRSPQFLIFDDSDALSLLRKIIKQFNLDKEKAKPALFKYQISRIKSEMADEDDELVKQIFFEYEKALERNNAFDFDDLIEKPVRLFQEKPAVLKKWQNRFQHILVDEFQDTNVAQYRLVKLLAKDHSNLSVVGDDAQSIYGWRHADFRNFLNFEKDWPNAKVVKLEQNYRSTANIIQAADQVIKKNKLQKEKTLWTDNPAGSKIKVIAASNEEAEVDWIVDYLHNVILNSSEGSQDSSASLQNDNGVVRNDNYNALQNTAILYRTNAQSRALEQTLIYTRIPYQIFGGIKFYERKEIKDMLAGLRLAFNPKDEVSLERLQKNFSKSKSEHLIDNLPRLAKELTVMELINFIINNTNYVTYLENNFKNYEERIENVQELIKSAEAFTHPVILNTPSVILNTPSVILNTPSVILNDSEGSLGDSSASPGTGLYLASPQNDSGGARNDKMQGLAEFLEKVSLVQQHDLGKGEKGVNLMTIHLSKGLEFDNVFVSGCNEGILPHEKSLATSEQLEEERRLMYVAMTRARKNLFLSFNGLASRFLYEIPPELVDFQSLTGTNNRREDYLPDEEEMWIDYD